MTFDLGERTGGPGAKEEQKKERVDKKLIDQTSRKRPKCKSRKQIDKVKNYDKSQKYTENGESDHKMPNKQTAIDENKRIQFEHGKLS